ncbi:glycoside hydrolase family 140 protein [Paenibacillus glycanilyticus]|uniref:glycoside hydrolase family 140 protein n=1 Tax=Paenibacillus glycanilyticus TaxID=126569 RepID=UPI00203FEE2A|nr:glycoside hydrolase family 140 protein [Paenibacillus glycanilyticus]MCM3626130.1 glycoside hydrolase family 140 protein [Paenibacillus glycanilyticus]
MSHRIQRLKVSENKRFLVHEDDSPFFWLADTAWELFHRLNREEAELYLSNRAERKFTVIQAVGLAEHEGLTTGNAFGRFPLKTNEDGQYDPLLPDLDGEYSYWQHVDYIIDLAAEHGLYIAFLPTWGDKYNQMWGKGPEVFHSGNARQYGQWLGDRYKEKTNLIWVLGGDRPQHTREHFDIICSMAEGLREGDGGAHLMTFHPPGAQSSSLHMHNEPWLAFNMIQSGHHEWIRTNYDKVAADYHREPIKPVVDGEPCYEDHPINFKADNGYFDADDVRKAAYHAVFAGAFGHTYGHHSIWSMTTEPDTYFIMSWQDAILRPGAEQMTHLRSLMESRPFLERIPDQSLIAENYSGANRMTAARGERYAMIYSPNGIPFRAVMGKIRGNTVKASWLDPRTGAWKDNGEYPNRGEVHFHPPTSGRDGDWILVLDGME